MLGSRAVRACMSKSSTSAFDFAYSSLARRGAPNCIRMNPRSRCASGMLGSSSTVYNEQPTSADSCLLGHAPKEGTGQKYNNLTKNPTYKRVCRAHPRAYGERSLSCRVVGSIIGSPPRIRGTQLRTSNGHTSCMVHPRAYGEHDDDTPCVVGKLGSSPRIRGTQRGTRTTPGKHRLIPTHTGNTPDKYAGKNAQAAHPHAYGEHAGQSKPGGRDKGSSPRIRGTHLPTKHNTQPKSKKYSVSTRIHI